MNLENNKNKTTPLVLVILLVLFAFVFGGGTVVANAEAVAETTSVQEVIDNSIFVTFRKGDNESRGKYMVACYFVPMEYYDSSYTYGAVIFPKDYGIKHGLVSDYLRVAEENGVVVINIVAIKGITEPNGYGFNFGITNIYESNLSRTFTFIFYAKIFVNKPTSKLTLDKRIQIITYKFKDIQTIYMNFLKLYINRIYVNIVIVIVFINYR